MNSGVDFKPIEVSKFTEDAFYEDNTAALFDADGDGDLDLYVGSGISEINKEALNVDRLYFNENGSFVTNSNAIPRNSMVTSTVSPYDLDDDGDMDLFIGIRSNPDSFGKMESSYILLNDGKGNFTISDDFDLQSMVMDADWRDVNGDNVKDLLVACEWDQPKIYLNKNGQLELLPLRLWNERAMAKY